MPLFLPRLQALVLVVFCWHVQSPPAHADIQHELLDISESLLLDGQGHLPDGSVIYQPAIIEDFYADGQYQPAWKDAKQAQQVLELLRDSALDGLDPEDYHYAELMALWSRRGQAIEQRDRARARFDVMLTDGFLLYVRHLLEGKVDPRLIDPTYNYGRRDFEPQQVADKLRRVINERRVSEIVEQARPDSPFYLQMKAALAHYRVLSMDPFQPIPAGNVLKPGQTHADVVPLRRRLMELGYLGKEDLGAPQYDGVLEAAVRQFQGDHGIDIDGVVGAQSWGFLNMSWNERVNSLRINMDRLRWVYQDLSDDFIVVNIAGFELYYMREGELIWETPVMTGTVPLGPSVVISTLRG
jgi:murein L,D-transpeptidase YcbB/YkuD